MDSPFGTYPLKYEVGVVTSYVTLRLSLQKVRYVVHLQWYSMSKSPTAWSNLYGAGAFTKSRERSGGILERGIGNPVREGKER